MEEYEKESLEKDVISESDNNSDDGAESNTEYSESDI